MAKIGLALGSGAARGWAHIGIIRALHDMGIKPNVITGTSIGSLVGAAYAVGRLDDLEDWVQKLRIRDMAALLDVNLFAGGLIEGEKLMKTFKKYFHGQEIDELAIPFAAVATDLANGNEVWFQEGSLWDAIRASIAVPGVFSPWYYQNKWLADGGLVNPVPISLCRALGAEKIIAVNLNSRRIAKHFDNNKYTGQIESDRSMPLKAGLDFNELFKLFKKRIIGEEHNAHPGIIDVLSSSLVIMQERITRSRMAGEPADVCLNPHLENIGMVEFHRAGEAIDEGRKAVNRLRDEIERSILAD